ncbi:putative holin-like toxin [Staphylococcus hominis]|nr:putative holin-like toxin [Staphylococcus hominis]
MISVATLLQFGLFLIALLMLVIKIAELAQKK